MCKQWNQVQNHNESEHWQSPASRINPLSIHGNDVLANVQYKLLDISGISIPSAVSFQNKW